MKINRTLIAILFGFTVNVPLIGCNPSATITPPTIDDESRSTLTITDALGREVTIPQPLERVVASGSGALRYLTYLQVQDRVVGVDNNEMEQRAQKHPRPYRMANPQLGELPLIGEFRGKDDPEKIIAINPQVIFKVGASSATEVEQLQQQTGIPVIALNYGNLRNERSLMYETFDLIGEVMGVPDRATALEDYIETAIADLNRRTADIPDSEKPTVFIGGIAKSGTQNFQSTEPAYPPLLFVNARRAAASVGTEYTSIDKEKIIEWDPDIILVDSSSLFSSPSAVDELRTDPSYQQLSAVQQGRVYAVWPYNLYNANLENILVNSYFIGQLLYPEQFQDLDFAEKADEIFSFFVDQPLYEQLQESYQTDYGKVEMQS
ncbi:MAG: iron ABC transporter substrate-binding protein [Spirulinaceae cyanobacterium]